MALPKAPPKSPSIPFLPVIIAIAVLLLLAGAWQSGLLGTSANWLTRLFTQPTHQGSRQPVDATPDRTAERRAQERWDQALRERDEAARKVGNAAAGKADAAPPAADADAGTTDDAAGQPADASASAGAPRATEGGADAPGPGGVPDAAATPDAAGDASPKTDIAPAPVASEDQVKDVPTPKAEIAATPPASDLPADDTWMYDPQESESAINNELARHWPLARLRRFLNLQEQARRLVATVDNLPGDHVPSQLRLTRGVPDLLAVDKRGETITLSDSNFKRYASIISFAESLSPRTLGQLYAKFYPLLQRTYEETGFPEKRFHDRMLAAIDDMLAAPVVQGPIRLVQPKVLYRFEDPELEALSPGRKIMLRIGPDNAERLKKVLRNWRKSIAARGPKP